MAEAENLRSVSVTVAQERLQIRTDLPDTELQEIVEQINKRYAMYSKYQMEVPKKFALLAVELMSEISELRKQLRKAKIYCQQMDKDVKDIYALLDENI
ncbi:MAG: hypothetical protein HUK21_01910 [Fibrobacteraceae bacterium]|nr:hypothetical protein [Fibrobacteraceae bacterium]